MEIIDTYKDGSPKLVKWIRDDGREMQSYIRYKEFNTFKKEKISYSVWGILFDIENDIVKKFEERFYIKDAATFFYKEMKKLYPISRINYSECILKKEYY